MRKTCLFVLGAILCAALAPAYAKSPSSQTPTQKTPHSESPPVANSAKPQPNGFLDLKWGKPPTADMTELEWSVNWRTKPHPFTPGLEESDRRYYRRPKDKKLHFGETPITVEYFGFDKNRFCSVDFFYDISRSDDVLGMLTSTYGKPDRDETIRHEGRIVEWTRGDVSISFTESHCYIGLHKEKAKPHTAKQK